jgi:protein SCO1/2
MACWEQKIASMLRIAFSLISLLLLACAPSNERRLPYYNAPDFTPLFLTDPEEIKKTISHTIAPFRFSDQSGKTITDKDINGKIHVANFMFTSCSSICPVMTDHMKSVHEVYGNDSDIKLLSYSVTPWIDDVQTLNNYVKRNEIASDNWHFLTGNKADIYKLARQSYFAEEDIGFSKDSAEFLHTEHFILVDRTKRIRGIYNGTLGVDILQLIEDIRVLKSEL